MGLFGLVVLFLVIVPGMLYLVGWGLNRYFPALGKKQSDKSDGEA